jgi:hypothetical protein
LEEVERQERADSEVQISILVFFEIKKYSILPSRLAVP